MQEGDVEGDKVPVSTPQGRTIEVMIPDQSKPGDVLAVIDETSHKGDSAESMRAPTDEDLWSGHGRMLPSERYNVTLPFAPPFANPHIYENPCALPPPTLRPTPRPQPAFAQGDHGVLGALLGGRRVLAHDSLRQLPRPRLHLPAVAQGSAHTLSPLPSGSRCPLPWPLCKNESQNLKKGGCCLRRWRAGLLRPQDAAGGPAERGGTARPHARPRHEVCPVRYHRRERL